MKLEKEALVDESAGAQAKVTGGRLGNRFHCAVKWEIAPERADVHEARRIASRKDGHAREANFPRLRFT